MLRNPIVLALSLTLCVACGGADTQPATPPDSADADARTLPAPPAPMRSDNHIYSGGWLISGDGTQPLFDAIVVVSNGKIAAIGKRGQIDVPADSIGIDASGKWLLPGSMESLKQAFANRDHAAPLDFSGQSQPGFAAGAVADFVMLNRNPLRDPEAFGDVHAIISGGDMQLIDP